MQSFRNTLKLFAVLPVLLASVACDNSSSGSAEPAASMALPIATSNGSIIEVVDPEGGSGDIPLDLDDPSDPMQNDIELNNSGAEELSTDEGNELSGWLASEQCSRGVLDVAPGNGSAYFQLDRGCALEQEIEFENNTGSDVVTESLSLLFDAALKSGESGTLLMEILATRPDGSSSILVSDELNIDSLSGSWRTRQWLQPFAFIENIEREPETARFSLRLSNVSRSTETILIDALALSSHQRDEDERLRFVESWNTVCNQAWAGEYWWANRLHDWEVVNGRIQTRNTAPFLSKRTLHHLGAVMRESPADFSLQVQTGVVAQAGDSAWSGLLIGAGLRLDYRAAALVHNRHGRNGGLIVGVDAMGRAFIRDNDLQNRILAEGVAPEDQVDLLTDSMTLRINGRYLNPEQGRSARYHLDVIVFASDDSILSSTTLEVMPERVLGSIGLIAVPGNESTEHWFSNFSGSGTKLRLLPSRRFGPVLFASHTLSRQTLTLNAQYPQLCEDSLLPPALEVWRDNTWQQVATATLDPLSLTAKFRIEGWDDSIAQSYRIVTQRRSESGIVDSWFRGTIPADPKAASSLVIGLYNCRPGVILDDEEGWIQQNTAMAFTWTRDRLVYPHEQLVRNSALQQADLLAFVGDQIYEFDPNGFIDKENEIRLIDDYFWKWYQFGWSVRELMRERPSIILPDDHDIFQGNVWGEGGRVASRERDGGLLHPARFQQIVRRTQAGSLPAPFDPTPMQQGIDVYFTDLVYGGVGFAILEDRSFKSGPFSDAEPKQLLGERQLAFLDSWARDWSGQKLKIAISQSPFIQSATHSGANQEPIDVDMDANGWPKVGRDAAVRALRRASAPHITGDQHLGMTLRHGIESPGDAVYSFAGPSMLNIFPRIWDPENAEAGPGDPNDQKTGQFSDPYGNFFEVLAVANPEVYYSPPLSGELAKKDDLGIGYGIVRIDKSLLQYAFEAWPANKNPTDPTTQPYEGWPIIVQQEDNDGRVPEGFLPERTAQVEDPVVEVVNESSGELVYSRRVSGSTVALPVFDANASYHVMLSDPDTEYVEVFPGQRIAP